MSNKQRGQPKVQSDDELVKEMPTTRQAINIANDPIFRTMAARVIRLEREIKPFLIKKYQTPEATKVAFDTPIPDTVIDAWLAELVRQSKIDAAKDAQIEEAKAKEEARRAEVRKQADGLPEPTRSAVKAAFAKKEELAAK